MRIKVKNLSNVDMDLLENSLIKLESEIMSFLLMNRFLTERRKLTQRYKNVMLRFVFLSLSRERERDDKRDGIARKLDKLLLGSSKCLSSRSIEGEGYLTLSFSDDSVKRLEINTVIFGQRRGWEGLTFASS